jgi:hypothetical protein
MHDVQLLGGDVSESERLGISGRAPTVPADALLKGLPSPEGLPPRPPWFACNGHFAPTGKHGFRQAGRQAGCWAAVAFFLTESRRRPLGLAGNCTGATSDVVPWGGWPGGFPADPSW